jgi:nitrous oxidase accessory protein
MNKIILSVGIILLFIGICIIPTIAQDTKEPLPSSSGHWLYVGGSGLGNYTKIQDAIDNASDGDTVFVYAGIYYENITIYHEITVLGENKDTTIIDGYETDDVVSIVRNGISFSGFTIQNSTLFGGAGITVYSYGGSVEITNVRVMDNAVGIFLKSGIGIYLHDSIINNNTETGVYVQSLRSEIYDNIIMNNRYFGIILLHEDVNYTLIKNNRITDHREGIWISDMYEISNIQIYNNIIMNSSSYGIKMGSRDSQIYGNQFWNNSVAFAMIGGQRNDIRGNTFRNNHQGLLIMDVGNNRIHRNNFIQNQEDAFFTYFLFVHNARNYWYHNYWDGHDFPLPKLIKGQKIFLFPYSWGNISWVQFDLIPALKPYDIT